MKVACAVTNLNVLSQMAIFPVHYQWHVMNIRLCEVSPQGDDVMGSTHLDL